MLPVIDPPVSNSIFRRSSGERCIGSNTSPTVDLVINDVNNDGYVEVRLETDTANFFAFYHHNNQGFIEMWRQTGAAVIDTSPKPTDGSGNAQLTFFRNTSTSGSVEIQVCKGDATASINHLLSGKTDSYLCALAGNVGIGIAAGLAKLHVKGGSDELQRMTRTDGTIGLSLGYNEAGSTTAYVYNRYSGGSASAIKLGFGSTFGLLVAQTLTKDLKTVFGGQITAAASTTSAAAMNLPTGSAPTSPVDGDLWREDNTNTGLKVRINGVTKTITVS